MFKKRHGEAAEADTVSHEEWLKDKWGQMREEYTEENICNADESAIYFRALGNDAEVDSRVSTALHRGSQTLLISE